MTQTWQEIARSLPIGSKRKVACCSTDPSTFVSNGDRGISLGPCFRCGKREYEPHGERTISEILRTRRAADALASNKTPTIPADTIPLTAGPIEAWQWVLRGGLTPEQANDAFGMRWHEASRRVLIPVWRYRRLIAVVGRSVHGERPKYRMLGGDPGTLYRLPQRPVRAVVVVEDILSAIAVWRAGANALAVLGTHVSTTQAAQIADGADTVVSWFDSDAAGQKAHAKLRSALSLYPVKLQRIQTQQDPKLLPRATLRDLVAPFIGG